MAAPTSEEERTTRALIAEAIIDLIQSGEVIVRGRNTAGQYVFIADVWATSEEIEKGKRLWNTERQEIIAYLFKGTDSSIVSRQRRWMMRRRKSTRCMHRGSTAN